MEIDISPAEQAIYARAMAALDESSVPYLVAGALALHRYTGLWRNTKDLDLFIQPESRDAALLALANAGYRVEITASHWLAKAFAEEMLVDLISGFGNWLEPIDASWFAASEPVCLFGVSTRMISVTDLIWTKAYVAGRERFDGADIAHLIRRAHDRIDWRRLLTRFGSHWELLLVYLHYYRFVYPQAREAIPSWVMEELSQRLQSDLDEPAVSEVPFRGPLLDRYSYLPDLDEWDEPDPREAVAQARDLSTEDVISERAADQARLERDTPH